MSDFSSTHSKGDLHIPDIDGSPGPQRSGSRSGAGLRFTLLGPVRAWLDGAELNLGSPQQRVTLAILLLHEGTQVTLEEFIDTIWGDDPPRCAVSTLRTYISRLRRVLHPAAIHSTRGGYTLRIGPGELDLTLFRERVARARAARHNGEPATAAVLLRDALALWEGQPLAGVPGAYTDARRMWLAGLRLDATEERLAIDLELGRDVESITELSAMVAEHPLRERPRELLMLALYRSGRQADALALFRQGRRLLVGELGIDPGPGLQRMHRRILDADPLLFGPSGHRPPPAPPRWTPAQLPPDLPDFSGRAVVLRELKDALTRPDEVPVVGVIGLGGVGKTALAIHAAHAVRQAFPDGQVYADLKAMGEPADPFTVLAVFLRAYGVRNEEMPDTLYERAALWRTVLAGRRVLIVLDNVRDSAQIRESLPATPGCAVVITGRQAMLDLPGVRWHMLDPFSPDEALALLERVAGADRVRAEPQAARRLVAACFFMPLPIRLAGARLTTWPGWAVAAAERQLRDEMCRLAGEHTDCPTAEAPLALEYSQLDEAPARAFRLVALAEGPDVSVSAAAAILELPVEQARSLLESLVDVHLMEVCGSGRYSYHGVVKPYARRRAMLDDGPAACQAAISRLIDFHMRATDLSRGAGPSGSTASSPARLVSTASTPTRWRISCCCRTP